jgi:hypothetical protein
MRFMKKSVILLLVIALVLSFALMPDVAEAQFKESAAVLPGALIRIADERSFPGESHGHAYLGHILCQLHQGFGSWVDCMGGYMGVQH